MRESSLMRRWARRARVALALLFAGSTVLYSILWMAAVRTQTPVELGFEAPWDDPARVMIVRDVQKGSPAEQAGMLPGDRILAINGRRLADQYSQVREWLRHNPGDTVQLTIERPGRPAPVVLRGVFRRRETVSAEGRLTEYFAAQVRNLFPVPFVVVGLTVLFLRLEDRNVWLLALMFASWAAVPGIPDSVFLVASALRPFAMTYRTFFVSMLGAFSYCFFAVFPTRSPLDRRIPWLKWVALALGMFAVALDTGALRPPALLSWLLGFRISGRLGFAYALTFVALGLLSLALNFFRVVEPAARRKLRVIVWGTGVGLAPVLTQAAAENFAGFHSPAWLVTVNDLVLFLFPLSFAYAVVKHRVLEIPVLLKRSARYLLVQRGFTILLALLSIGLTLVFALTFARYLQPVIRAAQPAGIALGAVFGIVLLWSGSQVHRRVSGEIDRSFFRNAYDARVILEDLSEKTRTATDRRELARLLGGHLEAALKPSSLIVYLQVTENHLAAATGSVPPELETISPDLPLLVAVAQRGRPWEFPSAGEDGAGESTALASLHPDCLVPMLGRAGRLVGLFVLGPRLSEEPYSGEDKRLLASVASQAATALENIRMAEEIAERMETERRVAREMEIAKEVQSRLLPQTPPLLNTLDCAARCIQARSVGGDYFDFLDLGEDRVGFVLADVSGKGVHAALLMANLQAHLRSQSGIAPLDPARLLEQVNRILWKSTAPEHYATLFFGIYDDRARQLVYVNCGHNAPVWLRQDGTVERLAANATVIGAFERWECSVAQVQLVSGDLLVVFSDGVTEAARGEDEFGEARLIELLKAHRGLPADDVVTAIFTSVQEFSAGAQSDDLTLLVARAR